jgi:hypothetical protein
MAGSASVLNARAVFQHLAVTRTGRFLRTTPPLPPPNDILYWAEKQETTFMDILRSRLNEHQTLTGVLEEARLNSQLPDTRMLDLFCRFCQDLLVVCSSSILAPSTLTERRKNQAATLQGELLRLLDGLSF